MARQLILTGQPIGAPRAYEVGFVNVLTEPGAACEEAVALAKQLCANAPVSVQACLSAVNDIVGRDDDVGWQETERALARAAGSADAREGVAALPGEASPGLVGALSRQSGGAESRAGAGLRNPPLPSRVPWSSWSGAEAEAEAAAAGGEVVVVGAAAVGVVAGAVGEVMGADVVGVVSWETGCGAVVGAGDDVVLVVEPGASAGAALTGFAVTTTDHVPQVSVTFPFTCPAPVSPTNR